MQRFILRIAAVIFLAVFAVQPADRASALTIGPVKFMLEANADQTLQEKIFLFNETDEQLHLTSRMQNVTFGPGERGVPIPAGIAGDFSLAEWITLSEESVSIDPQEKKEITMLIDVPAYAYPSGYYAQVLWSPTQSPTPGIQAFGEVGSLVLLRVRGPVQEDAAVAYFGSEDGRTRFEKVPLTVIAKIQNNGSSHIIPRGTMKINDAQGRTVAQYEVNAGKEASAILPGGDIRRFDTVWDAGFTFGDYTAVLDLTYGEENAKKLHAEFAFRVMPIPIVVMWVFIAVILIIVCILLIKNALPIKDTKRV
ncbi:hypothetical protein HYV71_02775 [Candidatus Uhrbacteria bacterium]|nr:hypothetical protein [Candidatus Uhrbacteria bacterium]